MQYLRNHLINICQAFLSREIADLESPFRLFIALYISKTSGVKAMNGLSRNKRRHGGSFSVSLIKGTTQH